MAKSIDIVTPTSIEFCCGAICPKQEVQDHIDRMQRAIDAAYEHLVYGGTSIEQLVELKRELEELSSD